MSKSIIVKYKTKTGKTGYFKHFKVALDWIEVLGVELVESQPHKTISKVGDVTEK